jgi:DNA-binding NarL/FixJ family response regulator
MNVLVVDSNFEIVDRIKELLLEQEDIDEVFGMANYEEAIENFHLVKPEIMVVDTSLYSENSFKLIQFVKSSSPSTVIIAISIYADTVSINRIKEYGANFFLDKYLFSDNISATLDQIKKSFKKLNPVYKIFS